MRTHRRSRHPHRNRRRRPRTSKRRSDTWRLALGVGMLVLVALVAAHVWTGNSARAAAAAPEAAESAAEALETPAAAAGEGLRAPPVAWWIALGGSVLALVMAYYFYGSVMKAGEGSPRMIEIAAAVREGAYAYLRQQYTVVAIFFLIVCGLLAVMAFGLHVQHTLVPFAFLTGGFFSALAGFIGMKTATQASGRTAAGAQTSLNSGLTVAFRAGAVMGLAVVGLGLLDITLWFGFLYSIWGRVATGLAWEPMTLEQITVVMLCFGMGASSQALFARVGGGIYTKAADVGADLVGKVEAGIPEDDPRNPATIADNVGDNVGDVAGMGADLYESYCGSILATAALGVAAIFGMRDLYAEHLDAVGISAETMQVNLLMAPMILAGLGIVVSVIGVFVVRTKEGATMKQLMGALNRGVYLASLLVVAATALIIHTLGLPWGFFWSVVAGLVAGLVIGWGSERYTSSSFGPTQEIADQSKTGPATVIISGIATGMLSTWIPIVAVGVAMILAFALPGGFQNITLGLYGVGIAAVGMLSTLGITLAADAYGPIADNAGGNAEMSGLDPEVRQRTDALDALGNTTAAIGKGFAIGSAALTALALLAAYVEEVRVGMHREAAAAYEHTVQGEVYALGYGKFAEGILPEADVPSPALKEKATVVYMEVEAAGKHTVTRRLKGEAGETLTLVPVAAGELARNTLPGVGDYQAGMLDFMRHYGATPMNPKFLVGAFSGVLLAFTFCALTMKAVGRAAGRMIDEVRRQFREMPGIMEGETKPDYASCVSIATRGAQRAMVLPSSLAIIVPVGVGLLLDVSGVLGLLVGGLTTGFAVAIFMANAGGAWDNAKKYIEEGNLGGKGSDCHKAAVTGDTVGDPFKDTSGPSLNILIKLMSMVSVVFAGLVVKYGAQIGDLLNIHWDHLAR